MPCLASYFVSQWEGKEIEGGKFGIAVLLRLFVQYSLHGLKETLNFISYRLSFRVALQPPSGRCLNSLILQPCCDRQGARTDPQQDSYPKTGQLSENRAWHASSH
jgi:hypothetical protein